MKNFIFTFAFLLIVCLAHGQIPKKGIYLYTIRHAESPSLITKVKCSVEIDGDKVKVIFLSGNLSKVKKGDVLDEGILMKHKSGKWIIGKTKKDTELDEIGGCTDGPSEIDFKKKIYWIC